MQKVSPDNRRALILDEAAKLFATRGYDATSMRDIASAVGMLPGSIYYHFPSKDEILATIYAIGVDEIITAVQAAIEGAEDPWDRLEAAAVAHLDTLLGRNGYAAAVIADWPGETTEIQPRLVAERDRYETIFRDLIRALPGIPKANQRLFRLTLLGALNWTLTWYKPGKQSPAQIARGVVAMLRRP